uniref:Peptidase_M13_N domain-containing protein n=1 Tax=Meloidogyne hapla TaxID=6305 RepID=A0A1I8BNY6_MELHA
MRAFLLTKPVYIATELIDILDYKDEIRWNYDVRYHSIMQLVATQNTKDLQLIHQLVNILSEGQEQLDFANMRFMNKDDGLSINFVSWQFFKGTILQPEKEMNLNTV